MIELGDQINFKATCILVTNEMYLFALEGPIDEPFIIKLSKTDMQYNQKVADALSKWKQPTEE